MTSGDPHGTIEARGVHHVPTEGVRHMTDYDDVTLPKVVSVATTAEILDVSTRTVYRALDAGVLERVRLRPNLMRVTRASIDDWIARSTSTSPLSRRA